MGNMRKRIEEPLSTPPFQGSVETPEFQTPAKWREYQEQTKKDVLWQRGHDLIGGWFVVGPDPENSDAVARYYQVQKNGRPTAEWYIMGLAEGTEKGKLTRFVPIRVDAVPQGVVEHFSDPLSNSPLSPTKISREYEDQQPLYEKRDEATGETVPIYPPDEPQRGPRW